MARILSSKLAARDIYPLAVAIFCMRPVPSCRSAQTPACVVLLPSCQFASAPFLPPSLQEVPVTWREMPGSKVDLVSASLQMARDIVVIRLCYTTGIWKDVPPPEALTAGAGAGGAAQQGFGAPDHRVYGRFGAGSKAAAAVAEHSRGDRRTIAQEVPASVADMAAAKDRDSQGQTESQAPRAADIDPTSVGLQGRGRLGGAAAAAPGVLLEDDLLQREEQR